MYFYLCGQDGVGDLPKKPSVTEATPEESEASFIEESFVEEEAEQSDPKPTVPDAEPDAKPDAEPDAEPDKASLVGIDEQQVHGHDMIHILRFVHVLTQDKTISPKGDDEGDDDDDEGKVTVRSFSVRLFTDYAQVQFITHRIF